MYQKQAYIDESHELHLQRRCFACKDLGESIEGLNALATTKFIVDNRA